MTTHKDQLKAQALSTHSLRLVTPDEDYESGALMFLIVLYVSSYR